MTKCIQFKRTFLEQPKQPFDLGLEALCYTCACQLGTTRDVDGKPHYVLFCACGSNDKNYVLGEVVYAGRAWFELCSGYIGPRWTPGSAIG